MTSSDDDLEEIALLEQWIRHFQQLLEQHHYVRTRDLLEQTIANFEERIKELRTRGEK
jgi:hypothetical protein